METTNNTEDNGALNIALDVMTGMTIGIGPYAHLYSSTKEREREKQTEQKSSTYRNENPSRFANDKASTGSVSSPGKWTGITQDELDRLEKNRKERAAEEEVRERIFSKRDRYDDFRNQFLLE